MKTSVLTSFKAVALLLQKAGPYLLLEIVLPGGTNFALLLFLYRRQQADGNAAWAARVIARVGERIHALVDVVLSPIGIASAWRGRGKSHDGLEALAIAPTM